MQNAQVSRRVHPAEQVTENRECSGGDHRQPRRETVQAVGQVHRIGARGRHERHERQIDPPRHRPHDVLEQRELRRVLVAFDQRKHEDIHAQTDAERHLARELPASHEAARLRADDLQIIIEKADQPHPQRRDDRDHHVAAVEPCPQQRRDDRREQNDQPAHRRRAALALVTRGPLGAHDLSDAMLA